MRYLIVISLLLSIGLTIALYRVFLKLITIDKLLGLSLQGLVIFLFGLILFLIFGTKNISTSDFNLKTILSIILAGVVLTLNGFLIMTAFRLGFKLSVFTPAYAILGNIFAILIGYMIFKEQINIYNLIGIIFGIIGIYFLSIK